MKYKGYHTGFTLIELMVVMVILGILTSIGALAYRTSQEKSRDIRRKSDVRQIASALEAYYNDKGKYPNDSFDGKIYGCGSNDASVCNWNQQFMDKNSTVYMQRLPNDPNSSRTYYYDVGAQNNSYQLYARLENLKDNDVPKDASSNPQTYSSTVCNTVGAALRCNYGVASANMLPETSPHGLTSN